MASYNVENYLPMERQRKGQTRQYAPKPAGEIDALVRVLQMIKPHILGLMEMGNQEMLEDFRGHLARGGLDYPYTEWVKGADEERHLALLSQYPIVARDSRDEVAFDVNGRRMRMLRGILDVTVEINARYRLRLVGAHLKSQRTVREYDQEDLRVQESLRLRDHVQGILTEKPATNLVVFGDLNETKNKYAFRLLLGSPGQSTSLRDVWVKDSRGETWTYYWKSADIYSRIDYFLINRAVAPEVNFSRSGINDSPFWHEASDHRAIYLSISPTER